MVKNSNNPFIRIYVNKTLSQNTSEENIEHEREIYRERYIPPDQIQKINDDLRLMKQYDIIMEYQKLIDAMNSLNLEQEIGLE